MAATRRGSSPRTGSPASKTKSPDRRFPVCGWTFDGSSCRKRGDHFCTPRADHAQAFCEEVCVHTKDKWVRRPFKLARWQREDIVRPLFGTVTWSTEHGCYVRRYRLAWIELARKNGKSELLAFVALYLLVADNTYGAEIYGCAKDRGQAAKVFDVAEQMVKLSPVLSRRLRIYRQAKRIVDVKTGSFYEVVAADATGNLGHNPHGIVFDEVLTQPNGDLWAAMRTGMGTRLQPLMIAATTPGNDPASFAKAEHDECLRVAEDPARAPHRFVYIRNTPPEADPWNEKHWRHANPALGDFLSIQALRDEAIEAHNDPAKENQFRQYRLAQWVQQVTRYLPLDLWDANTGEVTPSPNWWTTSLAGQRCWAGLDLSSKLDLTGWALLFDGGQVLWRYWAPESVVPLLDEHTAGQFSVWCKAGWITLTDGDVIDYDQIYSDIETDAEAYAIAGITYDRWSGEPVRQEIQKRTGLDLLESSTTYERMTGPMHELMRMLRAHELRTGANPVSRWMADAIEAKSPRDDPDRIRPVKPQRDKAGKRIDGIVALLLAISGRLTGEQDLAAPNLW